MSTFKFVCWWGKGGDAAVVRVGDIICFGYFNICHILVIRRSSDGIAE